MRRSTARALDRHAEARWPWLFAYQHPWSPLHLALWMLPIAAVLVLFGPPASYAAVGPIGAASGLVWRVSRELRRKELDAAPVRKGT